MGESEMTDHHFMHDRGYIVVEGPVGVGKTALARKLAGTFNSGLIVERPEENPFLARFYKDPHQYALPVQLSFLFQRIRHLERLQQGDLFHAHWVTDFFLGRDLLFAELTLDHDEFEIYYDVYERLAPNVPSPGLVIFLQSSATTLQERLFRRHLPAEHQIPPDYLERIIDGYARFFLRYSGAPLLMINAEKINFLAIEEDYRQLLDYLPTVQKGRHFFNPLPAIEAIGISG